MKKSTLEKRLETRYTGSKSAKAYHFAKEVISGKKLINPCYTSGRGRFTSNLDYTDATITLLKLLGLKIKTGNDAPRGSATGNWIKIITIIEG